MAPTSAFLSLEEALSVPTAALRSGRIDDQLLNAYRARRIDVHATAPEAEMPSFDEFMCRPESARLGVVVSDCSLSFDDAGALQEGQVLPEEPKPTQIDVDVSEYELETDSEYEREQERIVQEMRRREEHERLRIEREVRLRLEEEQRRLKAAEEERLRKEEEERARLEEEERLRKLEEQRLLKLEEERLRKLEEERLRKLEEERRRKLEEDRIRKEVEERLRKAEEKERQRLEEEERMRVEEEKLAAQQKLEAMRDEVNEALAKQGKIPSRRNSSWSRAEPKKSILKNRHSIAPIAMSKKASPVDALDDDDEVEEDGMLPLGTLLDYDSDTSGVSRRASLRSARPRLSSIGTSSTKLYSTRSRKRRVSVHAGSQTCSPALVPITSTHSTPLASTPGLVSGYGSVASSFPSTPAERTPNSTDESSTVKQTRRRLAYELETAGVPTRTLDRMRRASKSCPPPKLTEKGTMYRESVGSEFEVQTRKRGKKKNMMDCAIQCRGEEIDAEIAIMFADFKMTTTGGVDIPPVERAVDPSPVKSAVGEGEAELSTPKSLPPLEDSEPRPKVHFVDQVISVQTPGRTVTHDVGKSIVEENPDPDTERTPELAHRLPVTDGEIAVFELPDESKEEMTPPPPRQSITTPSAAITPISARSGISTRATRGSARSAKSIASPPQFSATPLRRSTRSRISVLPTPEASYRTSTPSTTGPRTSASEARSRSRSRRSSKTPPDSNPVTPVKELAQESSEHLTRSAVKSAGFTIPQNQKSCPKPRRSSRISRRSGSLSVSQALDFDNLEDDVPTFQSNFMPLVIEQGKNQLRRSPRHTARQAAKAIFGKGGSSFVSNVVGFDFPGSIMHGENVYEDDEVHVEDDPTPVQVDSDPEPEGFADPSDEFEVVDESEPVPGLEIEPQGENSTPVRSTRSRIRVSEPKLSPVRSSRSRTKGADTKASPVRSTRSHLKNIEVKATPVSSTRSSVRVTEPKPSSVRSTRSRTKDTKPKFSPAKSTRSHAKWAEQEYPTRYSSRLRKESPVAQAPKPPKGRVRKATRTKSLDFAVMNKPRTKFRATSVHDEERAEMKNAPISSIRRSSRLHNLEDPSSSKTIASPKSTMTNSHPKRRTSHTRSSNRGKKRTQEDIEGDLVFVPSQSGVSVDARLPDFDEEETPLEVDSAAEQNLEPEPEPEVVPKEPRGHKRTRATKGMKQSSPERRPTMSRELRSLSVRHSGLLSENEDEKDDDRIVRRGKRQRFPTLRYWSNEKVVYERRTSQIMPTVAQVVLSMNNRLESEVVDDGPKNPTRARVTKWAEEQTSKADTTSLATNYSKAASSKVGSLKSKASRAASSISSRPRRKRTKR